MIGIIIGIIACAIVFICLKKNCTGPGPIFWHIISALISGLACVLTVDVIALGVFSETGLKPIQTTEVVASCEIVALEDNSSMSGSFFLGSGSVNNKNYYAFYQDTENGYKFETLDAESTHYPVYIKYISSDTDVPHIDRYSLVERTVFTSETSPIWFSVIAHLAYGDYNPGDIVKEKICSPAAISSTDGYYDNFRYEIFIPKGSILNDYTIDLE